MYVYVSYMQGQTPPMFGAGGEYRNDQNLEVYITCYTVGAQ